MTVQKYQIITNQHSKTHNNMITLQQQDNKTEHNIVINKIRFYHYKKWVNIEVEENNYYITKHQLRQRTTL